MLQWFAGRNAWQKIAIVLFLWPFMALWWLWANPRFTTKTKAIVTAISIPAFAVMAALGGTSEKADVVAPGTAKASTATAAPEPKATTTTSFDAYTDRVTPAGASCEDLAGMWESARRSYGNATSGWVQSNKKAGGAVGRAATYQAAWDSYCSQYGSIAAKAH